MFRGILIVVAVSIACEAAAQIPTVIPRAPHELWTIAARGGEPKRLLDTPKHTCGSPDWSPDGEFIAYDMRPTYGARAETQVAIVRSDGTQLKMIGAGAMPSWSPDGTQLCCHTYDNPQSVTVMNTDGSGREVVINHWGSPRWVPRGNRIATLSENSQIMLFDLERGTEQSIFPPKYVNSYHYASQLGFGVSADGLRFCFGNSKDGLFLATMDEKTMQCSLGWLLKKGWVRHCSWSPDGKRVAYGFRAGDDDLEQIYVYDFETQSASLLPGLDSKRTNCCPDWSPDGNTIVFVSQLPLDLGD